MILIYTLIALFFVACVWLAILLFRSRSRIYKSEARLESALETAGKAEQELKMIRAEYENSLAEKNERIASLSAELARVQSHVEALTDQGRRDREELEKLQAAFRLEFRNLANEILEEKTTQFRSTNREALELILKPFGDNISQFRERVEAIYSDENKERGALQNEIKNLLDLNRRITEETSNLTNALKGNSKVQGNWGEMILETILESSSLVNGIHYSTQTVAKNEDGANLRPDVILRLPDNKMVVIDSKVSLTAFVSYTENCEEPRRLQLLEEHAQSVRRHVGELAGKRYQDLDYQGPVSSPDFVIMFVPSEPAFLAALQHDSSIWGDAYKKKVIISSPTNLFALLKIVDDLWKRDNQSRHALEIADEGARLYDKFVGFVETLEAIGKSVGHASDNYDKAMKQLATGSGNLVRRTEKLRELGVKASRALNARIVASAYDGGDEDPDNSEDRQIT